ncbi:hypothetical protein P5G50_00775 [Leifsonia sp. F6_8S_P_1B]|uniref:Lipoprotein n=1 Tax=Leifsonia williamsii TaxID=3035919 RepID=A0ABT8K685_9MICO|nr:hypothetical protein [Leifsonia williamsii]MDN4612969.1 hypothetical protein [Leifsonia williamsii]
MHGLASRRHLAVVASIVVIAPFTAGCASTASSPSRSTPARGEAPHLTGPWAAEFQREYERATTEAIRAALADGTISDQEYAEMRAAYTECLKAGGITLTRYDQFGSETSFKPPLTADTAHKAAQECSETSGEFPIAFLYWNARTNPANTDQVPLIVECFKRNGLVEKGYTVQDYYAGDFSFETNQEKSEKAQRCNTDPSGRLGG